MTTPVDRIFFVAVLVFEAAWLGFLVWLAG
jgi:hypothetical protein